MEASPQKTVTAGNIMKKNRNGDVSRVSLFCGEPLKNWTLNPPIDEAT